MTLLKNVARAFCAASTLALLSGCQAIGLPGLPFNTGKVANLGLLENKGDTGPLFAKLQAAPVGAGYDSNLVKIAMAIALSDQYCNTYFASISGTERTTYTGLAAAKTLFSFGGLIADGTGAKSLWSAYALTAEGLSSNIKTGIFRNHEATILQAAIRKYRKQQYDALVVEITNGKFKGVPFELLLPEIERYHSTCTVSSAITEVQNSVQPGQQSGGGNNPGAGAGGGGGAGGVPRPPG